MKNVLFVTLLALGFASQAFCQNDSSLPDIVDEEVFMIVEQSPRFPGCEDMVGNKHEKESCAQKKMLEYLYGNLTYPKEAKEKQIEGQVVTQFIVAKDGSIRNITLIRDVDGGCGEEGMRLVQGMNNLDEKWTPGKQRGQAVNVKYTLPIKFRVDKTLETKFEVVGRTTPIVGEETKEILKDRNPRFPGCEDMEVSLSELENCSSKKRLEFIYGNLKYPAEARKERIEGTVIIQFVVTKDGYLENITAIRKVSGGCTEEALRVVNAINDLPKRWIPGIRDGQIVDVKYTIPVVFTGVN